MVYPIISLTPELLLLGLTKYVFFIDVTKDGLTGFVSKTPPITKNANASDHIENVL
jgi:hypothetical protein